MYIRATLTSSALLLLAVAGARLSVPRQNAHPLNQGPVSLCFAPPYIRHSRRQNSIRLPR